MNYLNYTSEEMFSSTQLIRNSKAIFDKLQKNKDIQKAIILRDGKPSFILLDFHFYEKLMREHINLQESSKIKHQTKPIEEKELLVEDKPKNIMHKSIEALNVSEEEVKSQIKQETEQEIQTKVKQEAQTDTQINDNDLEKAFAQIEKLDLKNLKDKKDVNPKPLKEFWDK